VTTDPDIVADMAAHSVIERPERQTDTNPAETLRCPVDPGQATAR